MADTSGAKSVEACPPVQPFASSIVIVYKVSQEATLEEYLDSVPEEEREEVEDEADEEASELQPFPDGVYLFTVPRTELEFPLVRRFIEVISQPQTERVCREERSQMKELIWRWKNEGRCIDEGVVT